MVDTCYMLAVIILSKSALINHIAVSLQNIIISYFTGQVEILAFLSGHVLPIKKSLLTQPDVGNDFIQ